jgi:ABC-type multidrug transport system permease subunit
MRALWGIARHDLGLWLRSPGLIAASLLPALGMGALVALLTLSIGMQPVALVKEGHGPRADHMAHLLEMDAEAYRIHHVESRAEAERALAELRVAAVLVIPADFDDALAQANARVELHLNNVVDVDLADDIRRTVTRSLAEFDAPQLGIVGELHGPSEGLLLPNPFRVAIAEHDRRDTNVDFFEYELIPILVLVIVSIGLLGTGLLVARDFERQTAKLFLLAPIGRGALVLGRILGGLVVASALVVPLVAIMALAGFMTPPPGHWPAVIALLGAVMLASVGMGVALGSFIRNTRLVAMVGLNGAAYLFFLGGGFSTVAFLPAWLQTVSHFVPTSYAISGLRQALFYPDLVGFARDLSVLLGTAGLAIVLGAVALARSWRRA